MRGWASTGQHDGVALQSLLNALGQEQQAGLVDRIDPEATVAGLDQLLALQFGQQGIDQLRQLVLFIAQEQLGLEQRVYVDATGNDLAAGDPRSARSRPLPERAWRTDGGCCCGSRSAGSPDSGPG